VLIDNLAGHQEDFSLSLIIENLRSSTIRWPEAHPSRCAKFPSARTWLILSLFKISHQRRFHPQDLEPSSLKFLWNASQIHALCQSSRRAMPHGKSRLIRSDTEHRMEQLHADLNCNHLVIFELEPGRCDG